jgi:hypothetical protein
MVRQVWDDISAHYRAVEMDEFVVMPNHIHGIIILVGAGPRACPGTDPRAWGDWFGAPTGGAPTGAGQPERRVLDGADWLFRGIWEKIVNIK